MAINFNSKVLVVNPTSFFIGSSVLGVGIVVIALGIITQYTSDFLLPALVWVACGVPAVGAGVIMMFSALRRN